MSKFRQIWGWIWPSLVVILIALGFVTFVAKPSTVSGPSMEPNLQDKEHVWAFTRSPIHHGSVIVFDSYGVDPVSSGHRLYVKRVIGLPGDTVTSDHGTIYVNDRPINQNYISQKQQDSTGSWNFKKLAKKNKWQKNTDAVKVPQGCYFVLGDHRTVSNDSRYFGFVPQQNVVGVAKVFWWNVAFGSVTKQEQINIDKQWKDFYQAGDSKNG